MRPPGRLTLALLLLTGLVLAGTASSDGGAAGLAKLSARDLRARLKEAGLPTKGKRQALIDRLIGHYGWFPDDDGGAPPPPPPPRRKKKQQRAAASSPAAADEPSLAQFMTQLGAPAHEAKALAATLGKHGATSPSGLLALAPTQPALAALGVPPHSVAFVHSALLELPRLRPAAPPPPPGLDAGALSVTPGFLTPAEAAELRALAEPLLAASPTGSGRNATKSRYRTSNTARLPWLNTSLFRSLDAKVTTLTGIAPERGELYEVARYEPGDLYGFHWDETPHRSPDPSADVDPGAVEAFARFRAATGRMATVLVYLNTVEEGGATIWAQDGRSPPLQMAEHRADDDGGLSAFRSRCESALAAHAAGSAHTERIVAAEEGTALSWRSFSSSLQFLHNTSHGSCPVVKGTKWVLQKWMHAPAPERGSALAQLQVRTKQGQQVPLAEWGDPEMDFARLYQHRGLLGRLPLGAADAWSLPLLHDEVGMAEARLSQGETAVEEGATPHTKATMLEGCEQVLDVHVDGRDGGVQVSANPTTQPAKRLFSTQQSDFCLPVCSLIAIRLISTLLDRLLRASRLVSAGSQQRDCLGRRVGRRLLACGSSWSSMRAARATARRWTVASGPSGSGSASRPSGRPSGTYRSSTAGGSGGGSTARGWRRMCSASPGRCWPTSGTTSCS